MPSKPTQPRRLIVLGSTGSVGTQTLEVVAALNEHSDASDRPAWQVVGLAAGSNADLLAQQADRFGVNDLALADEAAPFGRSARRGACAAEDLVREVEADLVVAAIVGVAGLGATLAAIDQGTDVALANKETLVAAGEIVVPRARATGAHLLPLDSEHSGVWQCLAGIAERPPPIELPDSVRRVVITASGGALRDWPADRIAGATPEQALAHPNWDMGAKVTIDSASLMNKTLELIEAHWLFGLGPDRLEAVIHPQSVIHAIVELADGSMIAQLGDPDMRTPIQVALTHPHRTPGPARKLSLTDALSLEFMPPDLSRFPALALADRVMRAGGTSGAVLNAANERAVSLFLGGAIPFGRIATLADEALDALPAAPLRSVEGALEADREARAWVDQACGVRPA